MKCPKCGAQNFDNALFCSLCQSNFVEEEQSGAASQRPYELDKPLSDPNENTWAGLCHLATFVPIPLGNFLGPGLIWYLKRDLSYFVDQHCKEALNFQVSIIVYYLIAVLLTITIHSYLLLALIAIGLYGFIMVIVASVFGFKGKGFHYPLSMTFFG